MFDSDKWQEIFGTIRKNKLRTFLTAFSVAWGIFVLIVLLGCGKALRNSAEDSFMRDAMNSFDVQSGQTSIAHDGFKIGRKIQLTTEDFELIKSKISDLKYNSATYNGSTFNRMLSYKNLHAAYLVRSCLPDHQLLENATVVQGRFINKIDINEYRKVCIIGVPVKKVLFPTEEPINKFITIDGIPFKVVGIFTDPGKSDNERIYIPLSTAQRAFKGRNNIDGFWSGMKQSSGANGEKIIQEIRTILAKKHHFDPADINALYVYNYAQEFESIMGVLSGIELFTWIIGILTLIAGVVGVSNIMMIIVKERTKEIGIRKAIGASPFSIVMLIIQESVFITSCAGYIGLLLGMGVIQLLNKIGIEGDFFRRPEVNINVAIFATLLIIVAGALAGLFPALRAARVEPIEALRTE